MELNTPQTYSTDVAVNAEAAAEQPEVLVKQEPRPVDTADRIQTVDIVRGVALLGILMMNIPVFGIDGSAYFTMLNGPHNNADFKTLAIVETLFSGTMRGLFSMLFGAGMILFTMNKKERPGGITVAEYYYRRLAWLVLFGMFNAYILLWPGDILFYYGLCGMLLYPFRKMAAKWLILIGFVCVGIGIFKGMLGYTDFRAKRIAYNEAVAAEKAKKTLTEEQRAAKAEWLEIEKNRAPDTQATVRNVRKMNSGYGTVFSYLIPQNSNNETWWMYHGLWDMLCMMFIGMGLFALGFFSNKLSTSTYTMGMIVGYGVGIPLALIFFFEGWVGSQNIGAYLDAYRVPHWTLYDFRRFFLCLGHASLIMLVFRSRIVPWLMKALANVGQMAFTNYLMQSIFCTLFFYGYGLSNYNNLRYYQLFYVVGAIWIFQIIFSVVWLRYFKFGPFEWLWRSLTYWKKQPMKKPQVATKPVLEPAVI
jgi:uncharacterized protein